MLPSNTCKDMWNTFWSSLAFWVIIKLNENDFKNNGKRDFLFEDIPIINVTYIDVIYYVKGYHTYKMCGHHTYKNKCMEK